MDRSPHKELWSDPVLIDAEARVVNTERIVDGARLKARSFLEIPYAAGSAIIDDVRAPFLAVGSKYRVRDMSIILEQVMDDDVRDLEAAAPGARTDAIRKLLLSKFGAEAIALHASSSEQRVSADSSVDQFQVRIGRAIDQEARALLLRAHGRGLRIAAGVGFAAAAIAPLLNHWVSRKIPVELTVFVAILVVAIWTDRRLRKDGPLGASSDGLGVLKNLLRKQKIHTLMWWGYICIALVTITASVQFAYWLADRNT